MASSVRTTCPYCGVGCGLVAKVDKHGRVSINGDPEHPANRGHLCSKGAALSETLGLDGRALHPISAGKRTTWDAALSEVAHGFQTTIDKFGPDSVAFYVSGQLLTEAYYVANKLMKGYIGCANIDTNSRLCMSSTVAGHQRAFGSDTVPCSYEDLDLAEMVILIGSNAAWCHPVLFQRIARAHQRNPRHNLVVIDPRRTASCDSADLHLAVRPGSDAVLFNGLLAYLDSHGAADHSYVGDHTSGAEQALATARDNAGSITQVATVCGLEAHDVERFYQMFAATEKVVSVFSQGINQSSSGTDKVNSIINCHLLTGRIGRPGMGPFSFTGQPNAMGGREVGGLANQLTAHMSLDNPRHRERVQRFWHSPRIASQAGLKAVDLFAALESGRVRAVWIMGTNPVDSMPDADRVRVALKHCSLVVVSDCVRHTDTTACADIVLPATTWGEREGTVTNSDRTISRQRAFLPPPGEAKPDWWIVTEVARRMGFSDGFPYRSPADIFAEHVRLSGFENDGERSFNLSGLDGVDYDSMPPVQWPVPAGGSTRGTSRMFTDGRYHTADGRARLVPVRPRAPVHICDDAYPLLMNTGRVRDHWHTLTRTGNSPRLSAHTIEPYAELNPDDAKTLGVVNGQLVRIQRTRSNDVVVRARVEAGQSRGSVFIPMHWNDRFAGAARVNALLPSVTDPLSGQPELKHVPVRVETYRPAWYGFLLARQRPQLDGLAYWAIAAGKDLWRCEIAGHHWPTDWSIYMRGFLDLSAFENDAEWIEYRDVGARRFRSALLHKNRLEACLFVGREPQLPAREYLMELFSRRNLSAAERQGLLAGRDEGGPLVCACFGVGRDRITQAIQEGGLSTVDEIGAMLRAGTNCGSCVPELRALLTREMTRTRAG